MLQQIATQTHIHLLLVGAGQALLGVYEFESTLGLEKLVSVSESTRKEFGNMDFIAAKEEYDHAYELMELFDVTEVANEVLSH